MAFSDVKMSGNIPCFHLEEELDYPSNRKRKRVNGVLTDLEKKHNHSWYKEVSLRAIKYLDQCALFYRGTKITYLEMLNEADKLAVVLKSTGISFGDEVPVCFNNIPELVYLMLALNKLGAKMNSFDSGFHPDCIREILSGCSKKICFVTDHEYLKICEQIQAENFEKVVIVAQSRSLPDKPENCEGYEKEAAQLYEIEDITLKCLEKSSKGLTYDDLLFGQTRNVEIIDRGKLDTDFLVTYTSGTSKLGFPKAVVHTNRSLIVSGRFHDPSVSGNPDIKRLRCLAMIPPSHNTGLITCISDYLMQGWNIALEPYNRPEQAIDYLMINKPNYASMVSNYWSEAARQYMCEEKYVGRKMGFLLAPFSVGEKFGPGEEKYLNIFLKKVKAGSDVRIGSFHFPYVTLCIGGGDCEHGGIYYTLWRSLFSKLHFFKLWGKQIGMLPEKYVVVSALKEESGVYKECRKNELGIIVANSASTMKGYKNNPEETAKRIICDETGRRWVSCDVLGFIDNAGGVHVRGRIGDFKIIDGKKLYPHMIDEVIEKDRYNIMTCTTVFKKDGTIVANILKSPRSKYSGAELKTIARERCGKKIPKAVFERIQYRIFENIMDLPLTESGKRSIRALEEME